MVRVQVEKGERGVDAALVGVNEAEFVLARSVRRRQKERAVLPLYAPVASSLDESDFSAPLLTVVSAMVCCRGAPSRGTPLAFVGFFFFKRCMSLLLYLFFFFEAPSSSPLSLGCPSFLRAYGLLFPQVVACTDSAAEKLRVLATLFDLDHDAWLSQPELTSLLFTLARVLFAVGYLKTAVSDEEAESTVLRCLHDVGVAKHQVLE